MPVRPADLKIINFPDPRLRQRGKAIERVDDAVRAVVERMFVLMRDARGVGLAAPQVGLAWRLFVCQVGEDQPPMAFINPSLTLGADTDLRDEGCLSLPDVTVAVRRATTCEISAVGSDGEPLRQESTGLAARVWQHEYDHLDGRLIIDRMSESERIANRKLLRAMERDFAAAQKRARR